MTERMAPRASLDVGQSSIRVLVRDADGDRRLDAPGVRNDRSTVAQVAEFIAAHDGFGAASVAVGLTGFDDDSDAAGVLLAAAPCARAVAVAHDSVSGYLGANGDESGSVVAVGTGVVVLGVGTDSIARVDGWGALLGDAGGAYWIGRAGLEAVLRAADGRAVGTAMHRAAVREFGPVDTLALTVQADPDRVARVAGFAPRVTSAAAEGDTAALRVVDDAAAELARSIAVALDRVGADVAASRISGVGQVLTASLLRDRLDAMLGALVPGARLVSPLGEPIDGVERLHSLDPGHPLAGSVATATR